MISQTEWQLACSAIVENAKPGSLLSYAAAYAKAGSEMRSSRERSVQALYMLCNLSAWRGTEARKVRAIVKAVAAEHGSR
jgi:hypothetical protein